MDFLSPAWPPRNKQALALWFFKGPFFAERSGVKNGAVDVIFLGALFVFAPKKITALGEVRAGRGYNAGWSAGVGVACERFLRTCKPHDSATAQPY